MPPPVLRDLRGRMNPPTTSGASVEQADASGPLRGRGTRHRLVIVGADESEVVRAAGGLICDWSLRGWDVVVHLAASRHDRPLRILGANTKSLASLNSGQPWPDAIMASSLLYRQNLSARDYFLEASLHNEAAMAMLGDDWPAELGQGIGRVEHRPSPAARAFKLQAMLAAELVPAQLDAVERLRCDPQRFISHRIDFGDGPAKATSPSDRGNA